MKIEFTCYDPSIAKNYPPIPASKIIPDWYKKFLKADGTIDWKKVLNNPYIGYIIG